MSGADVTFQIYGPKKDEKKAKNILNKWIDRGYIGNITVAEKDSSIKTPLSIQSVDINQPGLIREDDEFILSCVARGSPSITFRWFKDGTFVNLTHASHKWIKLIKDPHVTDQYTALLAVQKAQKYDEGKFTCQVEDFNIQQCMSKFVKVKRRPSVKIEPMSLTVRKGQSFTVKCVTLEGNGIGGKYTYSWTKNKELLPVRTDCEKFETLYPAGTILQVFRVEKDAQYSCLVQDRTTSSEKSIQIYVLDRKEVHTCSVEISYDLSWPETAPDTDYLQECPRNYNGIISRRCMLNDGKNPKWDIPDFSKCTSKDVSLIHEKFKMLKAGYTPLSLDELLPGFLNYVFSVKLRPGEGAGILVLIEEIMEFLKEAKVGHGIMRNFTQTVVSALDVILSTQNALLFLKDVNSLQKALLEQLRISGSYISKYENFKWFNLSRNALDITLSAEAPSADTFYFPTANKTLRGQPWVSAKVKIQGLKLVKSDLLAGIVYRNLPLFFPSKSFLRVRDGTEIQYQINSQIITFVPLSLNRHSQSQNANLSIDFQHQLNTVNKNGSNNEWQLRCGYADIDSFAFFWDIYKCSVVHTNDQMSTCMCPKFGSFALMLVLTDPEKEVTSDEPHKYILISSFAIGIILTLFTTISLSTSCFLTKSSCITFLKLQCSISIVFCELLFAIAILLEPPQK
uniref:Ig-like domain-containing protein n=1 Tax=Dendroctonus ponderosae TaxID=77166 RepID=A0AAR5PIR0_DENPD